MRRFRLGGLINSIPEVLGLYAATYVVSVVLVMATEHWSVGDALWFGLVTVTTTGYGDLTPHSEAGRVIAVGLMIVSWLFNLLLGGQVAAKLIVNSDAWTDEEQEEVKRLLREIRAAQGPAERAGG